MPKYTYEIVETQEVIELEHSMAEAPLKTIEKDGKVYTLKRVFTSDLGIAFKGPGFYVTDNR